MTSGVSLKDIGETSRYLTTNLSKWAIHEMYLRKWMKYCRPPIQVAIELFQWLYDNFNWGIYHIYHKFVIKSTIARLWITIDTKNLSTYPMIHVILSYILTKTSPNTFHGNTPPRKPYKRPQTIDYTNSQISRPNIFCMHLWIICINISKANAVIFPDN